MTSPRETRLQITLSSAHQDFEKGLNAYAYYKMHDHALGEDLVQDTFMKTWLYLLKRGEIDKMKAFLYHVLNNLIIDQYRKKKSVSLDALLEKGFEPSTDDSLSLFDTLDGKAALLMIQHLPEKYRKVMRMRYVQILTIKEIALLTGQSANTVAVQTHRGLAKLKALYVSVPTLKPPVDSI